MYENDSAAVRAGVDFLLALTEKDYLLDPTFDVLDLESKLNEIQADVNFLISNLPVEVIDDDKQREEEYPGDFEDSEELEDEVVECEKLIAQASALLAAARDHYLQSERSVASGPIESSPKPIETKPMPSVPAPSKKKKDFDRSFIWIIIILGILFLSQLF